MEPGSRVSLRRDLSMTCFPADHRVPTLAFVASEERHRLLPEYESKSREEIKALAAEGTEVAERVAIPLAAFSGDTSAAILDRAAREFFRAKVLLLECSFVEAQDRHRAAPFKHIHLDEIAERADLFENEVVVLTHLTLRTPPDVIRRLVKRRLPARLADRAVPFLPESGEVKSAPLAVRMRRKMTTWCATSGRGRPRDPAPVRRPFPQRLPPLPRVAGGDDELDDRAVRGGHAQDLAAEESPPARQAIVRLESLYFFE